MKQLYEHPDGPKIFITGNVLSMVDDEDCALSLVIGHECLAELGAALVDYAAVAKRAEESADAGQNLARELVAELHQLAEHPPCESARALAEKLRALALLDDVGAAAEGFAAIVAPLLSEGIYSEGAA